MLFSSYQGKQKNDPTDFDGNKGYQESYLTFISSPD